MEQGELIDKICAEMYTEATKSDYGFVRFVAPWGRRTSQEYNQRRILFEEAITNFAKHCGIKAMGEKFYYFNGKIYERVSEFVVCQAYNQLMTRLGIAADYARAKTTRSEEFLGTIKAYNVLHPRNDIQCFENKVVDLRKCDGRSYEGTYKPSAKFPCVDYHPYPYIPSASAPKFKRFLDEVLPDKRSRDILQMFLGLGLVQTSEAFDKTTGGPRGTVELCLVLLGTGANGKSVLFNIICAVFGKNHITNVDYETMTADGDEGLRGRAAIRSATFNWSSDSDARKFGKKNTAMFKRICSGESYTYRLLGQDIAESENCPYLIFSLNELPTLAESTNGFLRRLQFVNFEVTIPRYKQDPNLAYEIIDNELPGVFNWIMRGAREIRRRKFRFPSSDMSLRMKVRALLPTNPVFAWTMAYSIRATPVVPTEPSNLIGAEVIYVCFQKFCENNDTEPISKNMFGRSMFNLGYAKHRTSDGVKYEIYGANEMQLRTPMMLNMLHDDDEDIALKYENDGNSIIQDD